MFRGDIYYMASIGSKPLRLTHTDPEPHVVNGLSDWTYEGGMFGFFQQMTAAWIMFILCFQQRRCS